MNIIITENELIKKFRDKGLTLLNPKDYKNNKTKLTSYDKEGYYYYFNLNSLDSLKLNNKNKFSKNNIYLFQNVELLLKNNKCQHKLIDIKYKNTGSKILILQCDCGNNYEVNLSNLTNENRNILFGCEKCKKENFKNPKKYDYNFVKNILKNNGYILLDNEYKGNTENLNCKNKDGYIVKVKFSYILNNLYNSPSLFSYCYNKDNYVYNVNNYFKINNINCTALRIVKDGVYKEYPTLYCKCSCGKKFNTNISLIKRGQYRCQSCTKYISIIELKVKEWLQNNNINFECQKRFDECKDVKTLPFDFYIKDLNICIEIDGEQHNKIVKYSNNSNSELDFKKRKYHDEIKNKFCRENNIKLIRIPQKFIERNHTEYIDILYNNLIKK